MGRSEAIVGALALVWGCSASTPPDPVAPQPSAEPSAEAATGPSMSIVNAAVVVASCPDAPKMNSRLAQVSIEKLVSPCKKVPGGAAHFAATLQPGGRIELASPTGDPAEGVVPTCVLTHKLQHQVFLKKPCMFDVQLEARGLASDGGT